MTAWRGPPGRCCSARWPPTPSPGSASPVATAVRALPVGADGAAAAVPDPAVPDHAGRSGWLNTVPALVVPGHVQRVRHVPAAAVLPGAARASSRRRPGSTAPTRCRSTGAIMLPLAAPGLLALAILTVAVVVERPALAARGQHRPEQDDARRRAWPRCRAQYQTDYPVLEVNGLRHPLSPPGFVIGRGTDADLRINDPGISRLHAEVKVHPASGAGEIVDLGSTNGIAVNGHKVRQATLARAPGSRSAPPGCWCTRPRALRAPDSPCPNSPSRYQGAYLALLWLFVLSVVSVIRSDLFGPTAPRPPRSTTRSRSPWKEPAPPKKSRRGKKGRPKADDRAGSEDRAVGPPGRRAGADRPRLGLPAIRLDDDYVSTRHARFVRRGDAVVRRGPRLDQRHLPRQPAGHRARRRSGSACRSGSARRSLELRK